MAAERFVSTPLFLPLQNDQFSRGKNNGTSTAKNYNEASDVLTFDISKRSPMSQEKVV
jgi:hypothetical protein